MNAGGVLYTCKSSEAARKGQSSGERVSNAWIICPEVGDNPGKLGLIPHDIFGTKVLVIKAGSQDLALPDGPAPD